MEEAPMVPLYNLADIYGVARNVVWKMRPDEKVLGLGYEDQVSLLQH